MVCNSEQAASYSVGASVDRERRVCCVRNRHTPVRGDECSDPGTNRLIMPYRRGHSFSVVAHMAMRYKGINEGFANSAKPCQDSFKNEMSIGCASAYFAETLSGPSSYRPYLPC